MLKMKRAVTIKTSIHIYIVQMFACFLPQADTKMYDTYKDVVLGYNRRFLNFRYVEQ